MEETNSKKAWAARAGIPLASISKQAGMSKFDYYRLN
jgi:hypothetical protein